MARVRARGKKQARAALPAKAARAALDRATQDVNKLQKGASKNAWAIGRRLAHEWYPDF